jgi:hypothetical protein
MIIAALASIIKDFEVLLNLSRMTKKRKLNITFFSKTLSFSTEQKIVFCAFTFKL